MAISCIPLKGGEEMQVKYPPIRYRYWEVSFETKDFHGMFGKDAAKDYRDFVSFVNDERCTKYYPPEDRVCYLIAWGVDVPGPGPTVHHPIGKFEKEGNEIVCTSVYGVIDYRVEINKISSKFVDLLKLEGVIE